MTWLDKNIEEGRAFEGPVESEKDTEEPVSPTSESARRMSGIAKDNKGDADIRRLFGSCSSDPFGSQLAHSRRHSHARARRASGSRVRSSRPIRNARQYARMFLAGPKNNRRGRLRCFAPGRPDSALFDPRSIVSNTSAYHDTISSVSYDGDPLQMR